MSATLTIGLCSWLQEARHFPFRELADAFIRTPIEFTRDDQQTFERIADGDMFTILTDDDHLRLVFFFFTHIFRWYKLEENNFLLHYFCYF